MSGLLSYSGLTTKIRAMQSHLLNDQNFREIVELESVPQAVSYLKQHKGYEDLFEGYNEADLHRGQIEKMLRLTVYRDFSKLYRFANVEQRKFLALYFKRYEVSVIKECLNTVFDHRDVVLNLSIFDEFFNKPFPAGHQSSGVLQDDRRTDCEPERDRILCPVVAARGYRASDPVRL